LEIYRTLAKTNPNAYLSEVAMALNSLGLLYYSNNAHTKAQSTYEEALEIYRTLAKTNPDAYFWLRFCKFPRLLRKHFVLLCVHCCHCKADQDC
jgi:tetratricopeptide (TPR) repeat protein